MRSPLAASSQVMCGSILSCLLAAASTACFQQVDAGAAEGSVVMPKAPSGPTTALEDPAIQLDLKDDSSTTTDPCVKTSNDAHQILKTYCGDCHDKGAASLGTPKFDFLMNDQSLLTETWTVNAEQRRFVVPADPDNSWLYKRILLGTMPPIQTDLRNPDYPRPTLSDLSVLQAWITTCLGTGMRQQSVSNSTDH